MDFMPSTAIFDAACMVLSFVDAQACNGTPVSSFLSGMARRRNAMGHIASTTSRALVAAVASSVAAAPSSRARRGPSRCEASHSVQCATGLFAARKGSELHFEALKWPFRWCLRRFEATFELAEARGTPDVAASGEKRGRCL